MSFKTGHQITLICYDPSNRVLVRDYGRKKSNPDICDEQHPTGRVRAVNTVMSLKNSLQSRCFVVIQVIEFLFVIMERETSTSPKGEE